MHAIWDKIKCKPPDGRGRILLNGKGTLREDLALLAWNHIGKKKPFNSFANLAWFPRPRAENLLYIMASNERAFGHDGQAPCVHHDHLKFMCVCVVKDPKTHAHLFFFGVAIRVECWNAIISKVGIAIPPCDGTRLLQWAASNFHHKGKFDHMMVRQAITTSVYFLWQERNARVFNNKHKEAATISKEAMMQLRILLLHYKKPIPVRVKECWNL
ncbi:hypothetical protein OIU74_006111 [Salix koriyanagi]|uniref:Reverse transcriptase zinc-binding domain-containing protein n=1 Tax=Salix koriyanagi TaxID=2511006 RepID=A0A9Q0UDD4_9ROSI|nr:hypothetical protein OIU74_006111 [Salix koriyanagi]